MFRRPDELWDAVERLAPRAVHLDAEGNLPFSFELLVDGESGVTPFFETSGRVRETSGQLESSGSVTVGRERSEERHEIEVVEGPMVVGSHTVPAGSDISFLIGSRNAVRETIASLLRSVSPAVVEDLDARVERYDAERVRRDGESVVDSEYAVRLGGLDEGRRDGKHLQVNEATATVSRGTETAARWDIDVRNHVGLFAREDTTRDTVREAREKTGFGVKVDWDVHNRRDGVSAEVRYTTQNGPEYADELGRRGIEIPPRTAFKIGFDVGDTTEVSFEFETDGSPTAGLRDRMRRWEGFAPLPVAAFLSYIS